MLTVRRTLFASAKGWSVWVLQCLSDEGLLPKPSSIPISTIVPWLIRFSHQFYLYFDSKFNKKLGDEVIA